MKRLIPIAALIALMIATGCGGSGSDSSTPPPIATASFGKAEFIKRANAICEREREAALPRLAAYLARVNAKGGQGNKKKLSNDLQEAFVSSVQAQTDQIRKLGAPSGDEKQIEELLAFSQQSVDAFEASSVPSDPDAVSAELGKAFRQTNRLLGDYGLSSCLYG